MIKEWKRKVILTVSLLIGAVCIWTLVGFDTRPTATLPDVPFDESIISFDTDRGVRLDEEEGGPPYTAGDLHEAAAYDAFFNNTLTNTLGETLTNAIYDPLMLSAVIINPRKYLWRIPPPRTQGVTREGDAAEGMETLGRLKTFEAQLLFAKQATSVAIGRLHRDAETQKLYRLARRNRSAFGVHLESALRGLLLSSLRQMCRYVHFAMMTSPQHYRRFRAIAAGRGTHHLDAVWVFLRELDHSTDVGEAARRLRNGAVCLDNISGSAWSCPRDVSVTRAAVSAAFIDYGDESAHDFARHQQLMRSQLHCSDVMRTCEDPEGCRFLCNAGYLLRGSGGDLEAFAGSAPKSSAARKPVFHRVLGGGSNNEYSWEESIVRLFGYGNITHRHSNMNGLWTMSTVDCTVPTFNIPPLLRNATVGFGYAKLCIGASRSPNFVSYQELKRQLLASEEVGEDTHNFTRLPKDPEAKAPSRGIVDDVSIFKLDIEGYEVDAIPQWVADDITALASNKNLVSRLRHSPLTSIDFATEGPRALTVSQFQIEFHSNANDVRSAHSWFNLRFLLSLLGFHQVAYEYNHYSWHSCCFEAVFVHHRFYVRSEVWHAMVEH